MTEIIISLIIPTFNRCELLVDAIISARTQTFPADKYEIIVVDNNSTDKTREVVSQINANGGKEIRYVFEPRPGLHWSRHTGARVASGQILAYTDDDAFIHETCLENLCKAYVKLNADAAGGKILIQWDREPPSWVVRYERVLGYLDHGPKMRVLEPNEYINGANFSIRKDRLYEIGGFNPGIVGEYLLGDSETGLCRKIHAACWRIVWVPDALVWHRQTIAKNATLQDMKRRYINNGICSVYAYYQQMQCSRRHILLHAIITMFRALNRKVRALKHWFARDANYYHYELDTAYLWGQSWYYLLLLRNANIRELAQQKDWIHDV